jgi:type IV pilus assembly protein PilW
MKRHGGFGVAELMISLTLGLLVMLVSVTLLVSANAAYVAQAEAASVSDAGRFALAVIARAARQAAFVDRERTDGGADPAAPPPVRGLDAASLSSGTAGIASPRAAAVNGSDVLALRFAGMGDRDGDGSVTTCAGFSVGAGQDGWSIFYVGIGPGGEPELRCKYRGANNWSAEAVISGVDSFQVLYGLDTDVQPDGQANRFVRATEINALDAALVPDGASIEERERDRMRNSWWKRVTSVKVALVAHGARQSHQVGGPAVYKLFGAAYSDDADVGTRLARAAMTPQLKQRERALFSATIVLRNSPRQP